MSMVCNCHSLPFPDCPNVQRRRESAPSLASPAVEPLTAQQFWHEWIQDEANDDGDVLKVTLNFAEAFAHQVRAAAERETRERCAQFIEAEIKKYPGKWDESMLVHLVYCIRQWYYVEESERLRRG